ncbi:uncharacterized protein LOC107195354 [Pteropus alecto]|uniref:uncharacterized protein LOC107195354 n=1 Tax=Pteropus alecto TaxID=9402 RepID=UPI000D533538|nr:uncharacterized protein LOC107195354 [Pteropus alecto]
MSCFTFSLHPLHFPPTSKLPPSPWTGVPLLPSLGRVQPTLGQAEWLLLPGKAWVASLIPSLSGLGPFSKVSQGLSGEGVEKAGPTVYSALHPCALQAGPGTRQTLPPPPLGALQNRPLPGTPPIPVSSSGARGPCFFFCPQKKAKIHTQGLHPGIQGPRRGGHSIALSTPGNGPEDDDCICTSLSHHSRAHCQGPDGASEPPQDQKPMLTWAYPRPHLSGLPSGTQGQSVRGSCLRGSQEAAWLD